jgi:asparagine synthase (glutamine-hydrolysing)
VDADALDREAVPTRSAPDPWQADASGRRVVEELARVVSRGDLSKLLRHGDRNSMHFSVESRLPFLTTDMADLLLSLPEDYLIGTNGETKHVFRAAMRGIVPDAILDRRDKIGFSTPESTWMKQAADTVRASLEMTRSVPFLRTEPMLRQFDLMCAGKVGYTPQMWRWLNFGRWHRLLFEA